MDNLSPLEMLQPETQTLILCHISCSTSLFNLIRASPRFLQVFKSRRAYILTSLALRSRTPLNIWDTIQASRLPKPPSQADVETFLQTFWDDEGVNAPIFPPEISISMIRLSNCIEWFISDFADGTLKNLTLLGELMTLQQDQDVVHSQLSRIEKGRIARAFCRFETFGLLYASAFRNQDFPADLQMGVGYLDKYNPDEVEEIVCVKDYIVRRLWSVFDQVEDDFVNGNLSEELRKAAQAPEDHRDSLDWFGCSGMGNHRSYMNNMMFLGLPFLKELFTAEREHRADMVLSNSKEAGNVDNTLWRLENSVESDEVANPIYHLSSYHDALDEAAIGWYWAVQQEYRMRPGCSSLKGLRDWGYVFWDKPRFEASGVLPES